MLSDSYMHWKLQMHRLKTQLQKLECLALRPTNAVTLLYWADGKFIDKIFKIKIKST